MATTTITALSAGTALSGTEVAPFDQGASTVKITATQIKTLAVGAGSVNVASGKTLTASNTLTLAGTDSTTMTFPSTSATIARTDAANTFTGAQTADGWKLSSSGIVTDSSTSRTLSSSDNGVVLYFTSGSAITLSMASGLGAGFSCTVLQGGAGQITFAANSQTMTVAGSLTKTAYVGATALIIAAAANTFFISGTLA